MILILYTGRKTTCCKISESFWKFDTPYLLLYVGDRTLVLKPLSQVYQSKYTKTKVLHQIY